ncbi:hypothetical protein ADCFC_16910 [Adlercreutzia hattorii]|uniref:Uncharacterized protein n=1 Tax=Adlercreutzia hattorii TaxID=2707299 RepID=A0A6F8SN61_9ACTN|nr:hypothetical protein ADCFC_18130 [Adlercreutzia hattorii]
MGRIAAAQRRQGVIAMQLRPQKEAARRRGPPGQKEGGCDSRGAAFCFKETKQASDRRGLSHLLTSV